VLAWWLETRMVRRPSPITGAGRQVWPPFLIGTVVALIVCRGLDMLCPAWAWRLSPGFMVEVGNRRRPTAHMARYAIRPSQHQSHEEELMVSRILTGGWSVGMALGR